MVSSLGTLAYQDVINVEHQSSEHSSMLLQWKLLTADPLVHDPNVIFAFMGESDTSTSLEVSLSNKSRDNSPLHNLYEAGDRIGIQRRVGAVCCFKCFLLQFANTLLRRDSCSKNAWLGSSHVSFHLVCFLTLPCAG